MEKERKAGREEWRGRGRREREKWTIKVGKETNTTIKGKFIVLKGNALKVTVFILLVYFHLFINSHCTTL